MSDTSYAALAVAIFMALIIPAGESAHPAGMRALSRWVRELPNPVLAAAGVVTAFFGVWVAWLSGQFLFDIGVVNSLLAFDGLLAGAFFVVYGISFFAEILKKRRFPPAA